MALVSGCALVLAGCGIRSTSSSSSPPPRPPNISTITEAAQSAIRFLEDRVNHDPDDIIAYNKLAGYYLQRLRETGRLDYLDLASRAAKASL